MPGPIKSFNVRLQGMHDAYKICPNNTPVTRVGPGYSDQTLAIKSRKKDASFSFQLGKNMSAHKKSASWVSPKWAKSNERKERRKKGRRQKSVKTMASLQPFMIQKYYESILVCKLPIQQNVSKMSKKRQMLSIKTKSSP